jgi:branched-chain amino acid transport system substrate-binding protein
MRQDSSDSFVRGSRRSFLKATGVTVAATSLAGCALGGGGSSETPKIGVITPLSGATPTTGQEIQRGVEMAEQHLDGTILDQEFETVIRDTASEPSTALDTARELVSQENVHALVGPSLSSSALSVIPYIRDEAQIPVIPTQASSNRAREGENCTDYSFFVFPSNKHTVQAGMDFIYDMPDLVDREFDHTSVHFFSADYTLGQNNLDLVEQDIQERGGEVTGSTLVPLGTQDLSSYISEVSESESDVVTGVMPPSLAIGFINQAEDFNLKDDKVLMFNSGKPVNQIVQASVGASADGWYGTTFYNPAADTDINNSFQDLYPDDSDLLPNASCASGFAAIRAIAAAMEDAGSTEADDLVSSLSGMTMNSVYGETQFREEDGQTDLDFIGATRENQEFVNLQEYPDVLPAASCGTTTT